MIDLHIHTKYSDGTKTPLEILQMAESLGLNQISITDHNCVDGAVEATKYIDDFSFDFIIGCELSCDYKDKEIHLFGYFDKSTRDFNALNDFIKKGDSAKQVQHKGIIEKLRNLGFDVTYDELVRLCPTSARNRVHIAQLLINKGYAQSVAEVFDKYVTKGKPCYVKKQSQPLYEGIEAIRKCGGIAVIAHFYEYKKSDFEEFFGDIIQKIDGIEAYHSKHSLEQTNALIDVANRYGKIITGGSDYHGDVKPNVQLGCANVPDKYMIRFFNMHKIKDGLSDK